MQASDVKTIQDIFASDVTRDIPPVIYFHQQDSEKLAAEVSEYIITGGYNEGDPRKKRLPEGIHEQFVRILGALHKELNKPGGCDLPACWISGFFGSGKSSFAKLLGLSLDHRTLPDGTPLVEALLERDDSPRRSEFRKVWEQVATSIDSIAVVFDIGAVARDDEQIHTSAKRQLAERLGYCSESHNVAEYELKLEKDGKWDEFLRLAEETLERPWAEAKTEQLAEDYFSEVMHALLPSTYNEPFAWVDIHGGKEQISTSVDETVKDLEAMLNYRAPGKTLFLVIDEVSQYIHQIENRLLKLQSFAAALGQRLKGKVWLMATGQQKLEEDLEGGNLGKMKDRFPPKLRVHLAPTNIRDVVHKRLLKKKPEAESELTALVEKHKAQLMLYGYKCQEITPRDLLEVYPMLPGHVDLLMNITSNLRARSSRMKGDDHAIRGLLQLLGELFRELRLGEKPVGDLVTLDQIYDVLKTALDADVQNTMARLFSAHEDLVSDDAVVRAAKAVALLQLIQEQEPTTVELVAQCLYPRLGAGSEVELYRDALDRLYQAGILSRSEKHGYKIQSAAGQEWARERDSHSVSSHDKSQLVQEVLKEWLGRVGRPRFKGIPFPVAAFYTDDKGAREERLQSYHDPAVVTFKFQCLSGKEERAEERWLKESDSEAHRDSVVWVSGADGQLEAQARELLRSRYMVKRYSPRIQSLTEGKRRLLFDEESRQAVLEEKMAELVAEVFLEGDLYFRARKLDKDRFGATFKNVLEGAGEDVLPKLYQHFSEVSITDGELKQLLAPDLSGVSQKFTEELGLFKLDAGKFVPECEGEAVSKIYQFIDQQGGVSGARLLQVFGGPPYGYRVDVLKACLLGLLRAGKIHGRIGGTKKVTSVRDAGVQELFTKDREFKRGEYFPGEMLITPRMRIAIRKFFNSSLDVDFEMDNEHIADRVFEQFELQRERLETLYKRLNQLNPRPSLPKSLENLQNVMARCVRSRLVEDTVIAVHQHLDELREGIQELGIYLGSLTQEAIEDLNWIQRVHRTEMAQLREYGLEDSLAEKVNLLDQQIAAARPWEEIVPAKKAADELRDHYKEVRADLLVKQETEAESVRQAVKNREGFSRLKEERADYVLRPVLDALTDTTPDDVSPTLSQIADLTPVRMQPASDEANRRLDQALSEETETKVIRMRTGLTGREVNSPEEVERMLQELRERLLANLRENVRIRLE